MEIFKNRNGQRGERQRGIKGIGTKRKGKERGEETNKEGEEKRKGENSRRKGKEKRRGRKGKEKGNEMGSEMGMKEEIGESLSFILYQVMYFT